MPEIHVSTKMIEEVGMRLSREVSVGDIVSTFLLLVALIGLFFTWHQLKENNKTQRAIFFKDLYTTFFFDPDISYAFYVIERDKVDFTEYHRSEQRGTIHKIDAINKLLAMCEQISALYLRGSLSDDEMFHFNYNLKRVYENQNIKRFFQQIDEWSKGRGMKDGPYSTFRSLGKKLGWNT